MVYSSRAGGTQPGRGVGLGVLGGLGCPGLGACVVCGSGRASCRMVLQADAFVAFAS